MTKKNDMALPVLAVRCLLQKIFSLLSPRRAGMYPSNAWELSDDQAISTAKELLWKSHLWEEFPEHVLFVQSDYAVFVEAVRKLYDELDLDIEIESLAEPLTITRQKLRFLLSGYLFEFEDQVTVVSVRSPDPAVPEAWSGKTLFAMPSSKN